MGVIRINSSDNDQEAVKDERNNKPFIQLNLNRDETLILLKACQRYRASIPSYIRAKQNEVATMDAIIQKLKSNS